MNFITFEKHGSITRMGISSRIDITNLPKKVTEYISKNDIKISDTYKRRELNRIESKVIIAKTNY